VPYLVLPSASRDLDRLCDRILPLTAPSGLPA
jgi:hypothetical protein